MEEFDYNTGGVLQDEKAMMKMDPEAISKVLSSDFH